MKMRKQKQDNAPQNDEKRGEKEHCTQPASSNFDFCNKVGSVVTVNVGEEARPFVLHEGLLTAASDFFRAALAGSWKETEERSFTLDDIHPDIFAIFVLWLYRQSIVIPSKDSSAGLETWLEDQLVDLATKYPPTPTGDVVGSPYWWPMEEGDHHWIKLVASYALGDRLQSKPFRNAILDAAMEAYRACEGTNKDPNSAVPCCAIVRYAYEFSPAESGLRKLFVYAMVESAQRDFLFSSLQRCQHPNYVMDIAQRLAAYGYTFNKDGYPIIDKDTDLYYKGYADVCAAIHDH